MPVRWHGGGRGEGGGWRTFSAHRPLFFGLALLMRDDQTQASEGSAERSLAQAAAESLMYNTWCSRRAYSCITVFKPLAEEAVGEESPHTRMSSRRNALCATTRSSARRAGSRRSAPRSHTRLR